MKRARLSISLATITAIASGCMVYGDSVGDVPMVVCAEHATAPECQSQPDSVIGAGPTLTNVSGRGALHSGFRDGNSLVVGASTGTGTGGRDLGAIVSIDLVTGERRILAGAYANPAVGVFEVGTGLSLGGPVNDVQPGATHADGTRALYAIGAGGLVRVDANGSIEVLWRGARVCTGESSTASPRTTTLAVSADERVYLADTLSRIVAYDPATNRCSVVSSSITGRGPTMYQVHALRFGGDSLWALDLDSLFRIDPSTGTRVRVSSATYSHEVGAGDRDLGTDRMDASDDGVWTAAEEGTFVRVDPVTGERAQIDHRRGPSGSSLDGVWRDPAAPLVFATIGPGVLVMNTLTGNSNWVSR